MSTSARATMDGNKATVAVTYRDSELIAIYPITPSSAVGALADEWAADKLPDFWDALPQVVEMQSLFEEQVSGQILVLATMYRAERSSDSYSETESDFPLASEKGRVACLLT